MALSGFEIATGGITSIPVTAALIFLSYKAFGEKNLDTTKYKPKKPVQTKKAGTSKETSESKKTDVSKKDTDRQLTSTNHSTSAMPRELPSSSARAAFHHIDSQVNP